MLKFLEEIVTTTVERQKTFIENSIEKSQGDINNKLEKFTRDTVEKQKFVIKNLLKQKQENIKKKIEESTRVVKVSVEEQKVGAKKLIKEKQKDKQIKGDLEDFLSKCNNKELKPLVDILIKKSNNSLCKEVEFQNHTPNHRKYFNLIAKEIRLYGSNSIASFKRGGVGVPYDEIVYDVCGELGIPCILGETIKNEQNLLELCDLDGDDYTNQILKEGVKGAYIAGLAGLVLAPLGAGLGVKKMSDPAYSVIIPCVIHIAKLRKQKLQDTKPLSSNLVTQHDNKKNQENNSNNCLLTITNSSNEKVLSLADIVTSQDLSEWHNLETEYKDINRLNPLLQALPSLAIAGHVKTTKLMEVVIKGDLTKAIGEGYRAFAKGTNGKIVEHARLFDSSKLSSLVSAGALFQVASVIVAQKHLADISAKLTDIKASVKTIELFQANERKSKIIGAIEYFEQVAPSVLNGNHSQSFLNQIEAKESELLGIQNHLIEDINQLNLDRELVGKDTFGSAGLMKEIEEYQEKILTHHKQLLQCIRARGCGWQLLSAYPDFPYLVSNRKNSILKVLEHLNEEKLLDKSEQAIRYNIKKLDSLFNSNATLGERKLELLRRNKYIINDVTFESSDLKNTLLEKNTILSDITNPVAKMIVKIENEKIVAVSI